MIVDDSLRHLAPEVLAHCERVCAKLRQESPSRAVHGPWGSFFASRLLTGELYITPERVHFPERPLKGASTVAVVRPSMWGPPLWRELEAGASTPEARRVLAFGMLPRIPCGECRQHWNASLHETPPATETAKAFSRWVWSRHNDINQRLGKPFFPFENLTKSDA